MHIYIAYATYAFVCINVSCTGSFYMFCFARLFWCSIQNHTQKLYIYRLVYSTSNDQIPHCTAYAIFLFTISLWGNYSLCFKMMNMNVAHFMFMFMCWTVCFHPIVGSTIATYIYILMFVFVIKIASECSTIFSFSCVATNVMATSSPFSPKNLRFKSLPYGRAIRTNALNTTYTHTVNKKTVQTHTHARACSSNNYGKARYLSEVQQSIMGDEYAEERKKWANT